MFAFFSPFEEKNTPEEGRRMDQPKRRVSNTKTKKEKNSPQNSPNNQEPSQNYRKLLLFIVIITWIYLMFIR